MSYPPIPVHYVFEDCGAAVMARVTGWLGALIVQADIASIAWKVFDLDNKNNLTGSGAAVVAASVYDTEQNNASWPYDDGYNFRHVLAATCFPSGGHRYRAEFVFTPTAGERFAVVAQLHARDLLSHD